MSRAMADIPKRRRPRGQFDDDFKAQAVRLVLDEGKSVGSVARDLDLTETALRTWVNRARADRTHGKTGLTTAEREELARLRKENRILREEREILQKAAVNSTVRRNDLCQFISWRLETERQPRTRIELRRDRVELSLCVA
jgi:transposase